MAALCRFDFGPDTVVIGLDLGVAGIDGHGHHLAVADRWDTDADLTTDTGLLAVVGDLVFEAFDQQTGWPRAIAADVRGDAVGTGTRAAHRGVATGGNGQGTRTIGVADPNLGVALSRLFAVD